MKTIRAKRKFNPGLLTAVAIAASLAAWAGLDRGWSQAFAQTEPPAASNPTFESGSAPVAGQPAQPSASLAPAAVAAPVAAPFDSPSIPPVRGQSFVPANRAGKQTVQVYQTTPAQNQYGALSFQAIPDSNSVFNPVQLVIDPAQAQAFAAADQKTRELLGKYSATEDAAERTKLVERLTAAVSEQFDSRQAIREEELKRLEEQLKKLKGLHDRRVAEKSQIIEDRVRQLLRDADGLGWGNDEGRAYAPAGIEWAPRYGGVAPPYPAALPTSRPAAAPAVAPVDGPAPGRTPLTR